mmetsp:Transcript_6993/g.25787  ORF Transcript_6993/g.25787 Transcript_6993/m.25787 type:complete len:193 (-) Transcript_6993:66-644(-)
MPQVSRLATASNVLPRATCSHRTIGRWSRVCSQLKRGSVGGGFGTGIPGARWPLRSHRPVEWREGGQRQTSRPSLVTYAAKQDRDNDDNRDLGEDRQGASFSEDDMKMLRQRINLITEKEEKIAEIEDIFRWMEAVTGNRIQILEQGRWEPFEKSGWRGWLVVALVGSVPLWLLWVVAQDLAAAGGDLQKLL